MLYRQLLGKKFVYYLEGDITFSIDFKESNFYHLFGLHKLTDKTELSLNNPKNTPKSIYEDILSKRIPPKNIEQSIHYSKIADRIKYFNKIFDTLDKDKCKIIIDFDPDKVGDISLQNTKYILYVRMPEGYFLFTLGIARGKKIYPETMFFEYSSMYNSDQTLLDVYDIKVIDKKSKNRKKQKSV